MNCSHFRKIKVFENNHSFYTNHLYSVFLHMYVYHTFLFLNLDILYNKVSIDIFKKKLSKTHVI